MSSELETLAGHVAAGLWSLSWQLAVLVGVVGAVSLLCRRWPANFRYWLWCIVLLRLCLPVNLATPWGVGDRVQRAAEFTMASLLSASSAPVTRSAPVKADGPPAAPSPVQPADAAAGFTPSAPSPIGEPVSLEVKLASAWAGLVFLAVLLVMYRWLRARRLLRSCPTVPPGQLTTLIDELRARLGLRRRVDLVCFPAPHEAWGPAVRGVWRPVIVLPPRMVAEWGRQELAPVLLHELAHIRRHDLLVNGLQILVQVLFFFHPLVWYANVRIRRERELVCDDVAVLHSGGRRKRYSQSIVRVLEEIGQDRPALAALSLGMTEQRHSLGRRIARMMSHNYHAHRPLGALSTLILIAVAIAGITLAGGFTARASQPVSRAKAEMMGRVEDFFLHNFRDVTARKSIEWGQVVTDDARNRSIRYQYRATIWDKEVQIMNQIFTFDDDGAFVRIDTVEGFPQPVAPKVVDTSTKEGMQALVEDFFTKNYFDITARKTIAWGEPQPHENENVSIRYQFEATIRNKDKKIMDKVFTFDKKGEFVSAEDAKPVGSELSRATPEGVARQFVDAMQAGDLDAAQRLLISREEFVSAFSGEDLNASYAQMAQRFCESLANVKDQMAGARFVQMDMSYAGEPLTMPAGKKFGPVQAKEETTCLDNVHAVIMAGGAKWDLKLDEMLKVGDSWCLIEAVTLKAR